MTKMKQNKYDIAYLKIAREWGKLSYCKRRQVGAIIVFNVTQINFEVLLSYENFTSLIMILAGFSCLIIMRIMFLNEKIKKIQKK